MTTCNSLGCSNGQLTNSNYCSPECFYSDVVGIGDDSNHVAIGEEFDAVIIHPNDGKENDPVAKVNGMTTFVRFPEKGKNGVPHGAVVRCRMADKQENHYVAAALEEPER
jgi:hypothetical protein